MLMQTNYADIPDISTFMRPVRDEPDKLSGPYLLLPTGNPNRVQRVQARIVFVLTHSSKIGVLVTLTAGDARRSVAEGALIPWSEIDFQPVENGFLRSFRRLVWRGHQLAEENDSLLGTLPDEAKVRFLAAAPPAVPFPSADTNRQKARAQEQARQEAMRIRDQHVRIACATMQTNHQKLRAVAHILRSEHVPSRTGTPAYPGKRLPTMRNACRWPRGAFTSWTGYGVFASDNTRVIVQALCIAVEKDNDAFWARVQKP